MAPSRTEVIARYEQFLGVANARFASAVELPIEVRAEGVRVWDDQGREYINCGGYGVFLLGHRHPDIVAALHAQLDTNPLATKGMLLSEQACAADALVSVAPEGLRRVYFASSGAEAVETAIKLARAAGRRRLVSMERGFHGKTMGALSLTDRPVFQRPFHPLLPDTAKVPFGDITALAKELADDGANACVVLEPVQGEGGVRIPPEGYLADVAQLCRDVGAFLVIDEIQTGMGRLGSWWGCTSEGVVPDVLLAGKSLGGGCMPVSAVLATPEAFRPFDRNNRLHTSTFGGSPLAMAAVIATIEVINRDHLVERARILGDLLIAGLNEALQPLCPDIVCQVRGRGLLIGIELATPTDAATLQRRLLRGGVITAAPLGVDTVVRLTPPAILNEQDLQELLDIVGTAARSIADDKRHGGHCC
jgi:putrescine aminotransferase